MSTNIYDKDTKELVKVAGRPNEPDYRFLTAQDIDNLLQSSAARQWTYLAELIVDTATSQSKVWSSSKITVELNTMLDSSKLYTNQQIARLKTATYHMVESTSEMINPSLLYLLPVSGSGYYDIYAVIDEVPTAIGTTQVQLDDYYTKEDADDTFLAKNEFEVTDIDFSNDF